MNTSMKDIEALTAKFADVRGALSATVAALNEEIDQVKRKYLAGIKRQVARAREQQGELRAAIEAAPELFAKPRTQVFHGVKVGFRKGKGEIDFDDADKVVSLIEKHLPEVADVLVQVTRKPIKDAILLYCSVDDLKKIGCKVTGTGDEVVIKDTASDVDKLVAALLKDEEEVEA